MAEDRAIGVYSMTTIQSDDSLARDPNFFSHPLYRGLREHTRTFSSLAAFASWPVIAHLSPDPRDREARTDRATALLVSGSFFETLGIRAERGRLLGVEDDRTPGTHPVAVVSHTFWSRRLGQDPEIPGRSLRLNGTEYTIVGVAPQGFRGVTVGLDTDVWVPLAMQATLTRDTSYLDDPSLLWLRILGRLRGGVSHAQATAETNALFRRLVTEEAGSDVSAETEATIARLGTEIVPFSKGFSGTRQRYSQALLIVGVVSDIKCNGLWERPPRLVYFPVAQQPRYLQSLEVRSRAELAVVIEQVRSAVADAAPDLPVVGAWTLTEEIDRSLRQEKLLFRLTSLFALLALLLAAIGLYGVLAYGVSQRTSEIGIRMALGAPRLGVLWMVLRTALSWVVTGVVIGLGVALAAGRAVSVLLFGLAPTDPLAVAAAVAALVLVAAFAGFWPARRASRLDPATALRHE